MLHDWVVNSYSVELICACRVNCNNTFMEKGEKNPAHYKDIFGRTL
jgi:hypothetical protein